MLLASSLIGGRVVNKHFIHASGRDGISVKHTRAIGTKRNFWMSLKFVVAHPTPASIVCAALGQPSCKWVTLASRNEFFDRVGVARSLYNTIGLVVPSEKRRIEDHSCVVCWATPNV